MVSYLLQQYVGMTFVFVFYITWFEYELRYARNTHSSKLSCFQQYAYDGSSR